MHRWVYDCHFARLWCGTSLWASWGWDHPEPSSVGRHGQGPSLRASECHFSGRTILLSHQSGLWHLFLWQTWLCTVCVGGNVVWSPSEHQNIWNFDDRQRLSHRYWPFTHLLQMKIGLCLMYWYTLHILYIYTHWGSSMAKPKIAPFLAPKTAGKYCCSAARRVQTLWPHSTCMQMPNQEGAKGQRQSCPTLFSNVLKIPWRYYGSKTCLYMFDGPPSCGYSKRWPVPAPLRPCFADEKAASGDDHFCWKLQ